MTRQRIPGDNFEERALALLKAEVVGRGATAASATPAPAWRRRGPRLGLAGAAVVAVAAAALVAGAGSGDTTAAFAVEAQPEGMVSVEVNGLEDAQGLEKALEEVGIPASVNYLAAGTACREPRFRPVPWPQGARALSAVKATISGDGSVAFSGPFRFSISRDAVGPGQTLILTAAAGAEGEGEGFFDSGARVELAEGEVAPCEPVPAT